MTDSLIIAQAGAVAGYELVNNGDGTYCNLTLGRECWNPLVYQADAERLAMDIRMGAIDLDKPSGRRALVRAAVDCCIRED